MQRKIAYDVLKKVLIDGEYANLLMQKELKVLPYIQRPFVTDLVNEVLRNYLYLKEQVLFYTDKKTDEELLILLSMAFYERFYRHEKDYVVNNEYTSLATNKHAKGFVNALLHKADHLNDLDLPPFEKEALEASLPLWIAKMWHKQYSEEEYAYLLKDLSNVPSITYRLNPLKGNKEALIKEGAIFFDTYGFKSEHNLLNEEGFKNGDYYVQDKNAMALTSMLKLEENDIFLDICSAPGSKFYNALEVIKEENAYSNDANPKREDLVVKNAARLGYTKFHSSAIDGRELKNYFDIKFNKILLDAPCSGLGVLKKKPELRYRLKGEDLDGLEKLQKELLDSAYEVLEDGGTLLYSTCTLNKKENEKQVASFLTRHEDMKLIEEKLFLKEDGDHFYGAILKKN